MLNHGCHSCSSVYYYYRYVTGKKLGAKDYQQKSLLKIGEHITLERSPKKWLLVASLVSPIYLAPLNYFIAIEKPFCQTFSQKGFSSTGKAVSLKKPEPNLFLEEPESCQTAPPKHDLKGPYVIFR